MQLCRIFVCNNVEEMNNSKELLKPSAHEKRNLSKLIYVQNEALKKWVKNRQREPIK